MVISSKNLMENFLIKDQKELEKSFDKLSDEEVLLSITKLKEKLKESVSFLGHHYQQDDIIRFADISGDSLILAQKGSESEKPYTIFCGVHFMAETADILSRAGQAVILPDLAAGCSMADMASIEEVKSAWTFLEKFSPNIVPVTYINSTAALKSFVGEKGGLVCTSSNAEKMIKKAIGEIKDDSKKLFFFPDQHLGRYTCYKMGIPLSEMVIYNPHLPNGGLTEDQVVKAKVFLWYGHCSVHQGFTANQIKDLRQNSPDTQILVHPECSFDVVISADKVGSTAFIVNEVEKAPDGSKFAIGTEVNLVNRLAKKFPKKEISSLSPYQCLCSTMYRIHPRALLASLVSIEETLLGKRSSPINVIKVDEETKKWASVALKRMLEE